MRDRKVMVESGLYKYYSKVLTPDNKTLYFKGNKGSVEKFRNTVRSYYAANYDSADAYNLTFLAISNVSILPNTNESDYIEV